ncbi:UBX domain-containing protein 6 [Malurus melanocephalus]|uniref:UBX domain-containing protein 6 n=1 Tax=Malurus melanocephalus TaxID=175006 RepID=UPI002548AA3B|nr:UBX domain-containing protein 6 [Malurus melanocephalus]
MRKFFQEIKADLKFKTAGPGQKLSEPSRAPKEKPKAEVAPKPRQAPTDEAQKAAAAALARLELKPKGKAPCSSQEAIKNQVKKELMAEAAASEKGLSVEEKEQEEEGAAAPSVSGVYFICPLTGDVVRKDQKEKHLREAIQAYFSVDPVAASIMEIHTFNKDRDKVRLCVETMAKYLDNIYLHPEEEKYRKIKLQNKVFQERISCLEGTHKFFQAVGFETKTLSVPEQDSTEEYYVLKEEMLSRLEELKEHKEQLLSSEPVRAQLHRQLTVFQPSASGAAARFELPHDFFNLTAEELRREQRLRTEAVEKASMLRTRAMREKEEQREMRKYNYTLLRVRFPDGYILQGTFYARESVSALYKFVREALKEDWLPFELLAPGGVKLTDENLAFNECGLVPSALLSLAWDAAVMADVEAAAAAEEQCSALKAELLAGVQTLS